MGSERHVFRFFVDVVGSTGSTVELDAFDERHARVLLRAHAEDPVEVVDRDGAVWHATFDGPSARLTLGEQVAAEAEPAIVLHAFVQVGGRIDELVDGAVQAGATRIVPVVRTARDAAKVDQRLERLMRISTTAAKQAKRASVPTVSSAIDTAALVTTEPGIVVVPGAELRLDELVRTVEPGAAISLLVGGTDGFPDGLLDTLEEAGWRQGRLGSSILRSELAAAVCVAIAAMHAPAP